MQKRALIGASALSAASLLAYGVRGRSSQLFGPSIYRGPRNKRTIALTFDDGPSESTPRILKLLSTYQVPATFFQCGVNIRRLPAVARDVLAQGHEIGNHSDTHPALYLRSTNTIYREFEAAQLTIQRVIGVTPTLLRAPLGARWFGFDAMQRQLDLLGVMWTTIGRDWKLEASQVAKRVLDGAQNGAIICLHDGRELTPNPDIHSTIDALTQILPALLAEGYNFETVSQLTCRTTK